MGNYCSLRTGIWLLSCAKMEGVRDFCVCQGIWRKSGRWQGFLGCFFRMLAQLPLPCGLGTFSALEFFPHWFNPVSFGPLVNIHEHPRVLHWGDTQQCHCPCHLMRMSAKVLAWWVLGCELSQSCGRADPNFSTLCCFNDSNRKSIYRQEQIAFLYGEEDNSSHVLHY